MNELDRILKRFRESESPVIMTSAEHLLLCSHYGAIRPNDYQNPFMGKVIEIREPQHILPGELVLEEGEYEAPDTGTFIAPEIIEEGDDGPIIDALEQGSDDVDYTDPDAVLEEDPYA